MNQWQFDTIVATLQSAVPALAENLCNALAKVITDNQEMSKKLKEMEKTEEKEND